MKRIEQRTSYAMLKMEVDLAWERIDAATDYRALQDAMWDWWEARQALRDFLRGDV